MLLRYTVSALLSACSVLAAGNDTESTSTSTVESFVTVLVSPTATSEPSTNGLGDFIMQGLGESDTSSTSSVVALPDPASTAPFPAGNTTSSMASNNATAAAGWEACQTSQISWSDGWSSVFQPETVTSTYTYTIINATITFNVTFGNADVYTTIDGIPHAHGELKPTSTSQFVDTYIEAETSTNTYTTSLDATYPEPSPECTIGSLKCTALWQSYLGEQGMPTTVENATEPAITPMPTERPRCSLGNVTQICETLPKPSCVFSAQRVDLYYWPEVTAAPNASLANSSAIATQVVGNITMTSPSVYLVFDHLQAISSTDLDMRCSLSRPLGATGTVGVVGGAARSYVGGPYTDAVVSLDPISLTSLVRDLGPVNTASVVSEIAHGGPSYDYWVNAVHGTRRNYNGERGFYSSVLAKPVDYANFEVPDAEAYYMNINVPPGCNRMGDHPQCSTIFDGAYRAQLLVPEQVRTLRPEWAECYDPLFGALDPPIALTAAGSIKTPTKPDPKPDPPQQTPAREKPADELNEPTPAIPGPTPPSDPSPTPPPADSDTDPEAEEPSSNDGSASGGNSVPSDNSDNNSGASDGQSGSDDQSGSNGQSGSSDQSDPEVQTGSGGNSNSNDNSTPDSENASNNSPASGDSPNSPSDSSSGNEESGAQNNSPQNPANDQSNGSGDSGSSGGAQSGSSSNNGQSSGESSNTGGGLSGSPESQDNGSGAGSNTKGQGNQTPQNALDVLSAAQQDNEAKKTSGPGVENGSTGSTGSQSNGGSNGSPGGTGVEPNGGSDGTPGGSSNTGQSSGNSQGGSNNDGSTNENGQSSGNSGNGGGSNGISGSNTNDQPAEQVVDIDGSQHTVAAPGGVAVIDGTTLPADGTPTTINGQTVSAVSGGIAIGTQTISLDSNRPAGTGSSQEAVAVIDGQRYTAAPGNNDGVVVFDGTTLTVGGSATTAHGVTLSAASNGIVIGGSTMSYSDVPEPQRLAVLTLGSSVATASQVSSDIFAIGTVTLTAGGSDATISGHTVSAASTGIVVDSSSTAPGASGTQDAQDPQSTNESEDSPSTAEGSASSVGVVDWTTLNVFLILLML